MKKHEATTALKDAQLKKGHRVNTRKTYRHWLCRYIAGASDGRWSNLQGFLDDLTSVQRVNPKTVKQALNAMVFFYKNVLHETTEIYTHVTGGHGTASPLDMPPQIVRFPQQTGKEASA